MKTTQWSIVQQHRVHVEYLVRKMPREQQERARKELAQIDKEYPWAIPTGAFYDGG